MAQGRGGCCSVGCPCLLHPVHPLPWHPQGSSSSFPCAPRWSPRQERGRAALGAGARCLQPSAHPHTPLGTGLGHPGLPGGEGFPGQHQHHPHVSVEQTRQGLGYKGHFSPWAIQESVFPAPKFLNLKIPQGSCWLRLRRGGRVCLRQQRLRDPVPERGAAGGHRQRLQRAAGTAGRGHRPSLGAPPPGQRHRRGEV